ncbi:hypothetical protein MPSEU_000424300 [Mayamaea pseudoterrestris]|nr:hypothetical protein MPSEU_000424300 [Mayamaea pseudoterrestris]
MYNVCTSLTVGLAQNNWTTNHRRRAKRRPFTVNMSKGKTERAIASEDGAPSPSVAIVPDTNETIVVPPHYIEHSKPNLDGDYAYPSLLHNIHIQSVLTSAEASTCLELSVKHASRTGCWARRNFDRHASYATCDFAVDECDSLTQYLEKIGFSQRMFHLLSHLYQVPFEGLSFLDLFCAHYQAKENDESSIGMDRLELHRDGSLLSFVVLLNPSRDFEGGGTFFDALRDEKIASRRLQKGVIRVERPGDATIHSGKLLHGADVVTKGERTVLVGFVSVDEILLRKGVLFKACRDFGRMDVITKRYKRQLQKTSDGSNGWMMNHDRWLMDNGYSSCGNVLRGFSPAFGSVERRADTEFQRMKKLEAEDTLLRSILLDTSERGGVHYFGAGDVTLL